MRHTFYRLGRLYAASLMLVLLAIACAIAVVGLSLTVPWILKEVLDYGLATLRTGQPVTTMGGSTAFAGTPGYAAPEQLDGGPVDERSDIFSFGVTLCELVVGSNP